MAISCLCSVGAWLGACARIPFVVAVVGAFTTPAAIVLAFVPADDEPNKVLADAKVLGMTAVMVGSGVAVYCYAGRRERAPL